MGTTSEPSREWDREAVRTAIRVGDWPSVLTMCGAGLPQTEVALRAGISQAQVSRLANGRSSAPSMATVRALCRALNIPLELAGLLDEEGDDTDRRQFLAAAAGAAASTIVPPGRDDVAHVRATTIAYRRLEQTTPSATMIGAVAGQLRLAQHLAESAHGAAQSRMYAAVSEAAGLLGWLHADQANHAAALRHYKWAIQASRRSNTPLLLTYMQASLGQYAITVGDTTVGLNLIEKAVGQLPPSAPSVARAWLASLAAVGHAHRGDTAALDLLGEAERHATGALNDDPPWPWLMRFDQHKLNQLSVTVAGRLGRPVNLPPGLSNRVASPKQTALTLVEYARAELARGNLDTGCHLAGQAHSLAAIYGSVRVLHGVRQFRATIQGSPSPAVHELDEQITSTYLRADT